MKVKFITLGCKVNQYESQAMLEHLLAHGFLQAAAEEPADVVVLNSCTVTATSDQKVRQTLRRARRDNPDAVTVLTGCMPQAFPAEAEALQEADVVLGTANRGALLSQVLRFLSTRQRIVDIAPHEKGEAFEPMRVSSFHGRTRAFLKIEDGCNRFCSYCIIPYARGRVRSKPLEAIREETARLASAGYREIVLTGINLPAYGDEIGLSLCDAAEAVCAVPGVLRVRLGSLEPERLTPEVIARMAALPKLCPQFHLSLQSGCDETLRRMNRHYSTAEYRKITEDLRSAFPGCAITTDIMVGFSGETEEEFSHSLAFAEEIGFARAHVFAYSRRPGTAACSAPGQVSRREKEARSRRMIDLTARTQLAFHRAQVGRTEEVLVEQAAGEGLWEGYTPSYIHVRVPGGPELAGRILPVRITAAGQDGCEGVPV